VTVVAVTGRRPVGCTMAMVTSLQLPHRLRLDLLVTLPNTPVSRGPASGMDSSQMSPTLYRTDEDCCARLELSLRT